MRFHFAVSSGVALFGTIGLLLAFASHAAADHPYDPRRYAFELFSEDEIALSKYAGRVDENTVSVILEHSWAELDSAAAKTAHLSPEESKRRIQEAVRGDGGISENFENRLKRESGLDNTSSSLKSRFTDAARHPLIWAVVALFLAVLFWINRKRP